MVYVGFHLHWSMDSVLDLGRADRYQVIRQINELLATSYGGVWGVEPVS